MEPCYAKNGSMRHAVPSLVLALGGCVSRTGLAIPGTNTYAFDESRS